MEANTSIMVQKLDMHGHVTWSYSGRLLDRGQHHMIIEALFDKEDFVLLGVLWKKGDRFIETYYDDRAYNVFVIFDRDTGAFKGWYCNLSRPAQFSAEQIAWVDLALDLWVWPDGRRAVLDRDEFEALPLEADERARVERALVSLEQDFEGREPPSPEGAGAFN